jgi:hypothetical protein
MRSLQTKNPKTTYYNEFPKEPRPTCSLAHVFWVVANDHRALSRGERRNVIYPAKAAGLILDAPRDHLGVQLNLKGETSRCAFVLTEKGRAYYDGHVSPVLPKGFTSDAPLPKVRTRSNPTLSTADLKASK